MKINQPGVKHSGAWRNTTSTWLQPQLMALHLLLA